MLFFQTEHFIIKLHTINHSINPFFFFFLFIIVSVIKDGAVVRALASHQCGLGSIPGLAAICGLSLLLVLVPAPRGFSPGTPVFPSPQKPTLLNSNSIWIIVKHFYHEPLAREIVQALPVLLTLNKLLTFL